MNGSYSTALPNSRNLHMPSKVNPVEGLMRGGNRLVLSLRSALIGMSTKQGGLARPSPIGLVSCPSKGLIFSTNFAQTDNS